MKRKQEIKPINFKKYFMPTVNQLVSRTRNLHALVLVLTVGIYFGMYKAFEYGMLHTEYHAITMRSRVLVLLAGLVLFWFCIYLVGQAFDVSLKLNYNAMVQAKKLPVFNFTHGWRASLTNSLYYLNTFVLGGLVVGIMEFINSRTFDYQASAERQRISDYYFYDKTELQQFFETHSSSSLISALILFFIVSMISAVFSGTNSQISYGNKSGLECSIRALRRLNAKTWVTLSVLRFIYAFILIAVCYMGYMIYDYFGDFGSFAGPGIALVCFYFLYPYVVTLHTGYYFRYQKGDESLQEDLEVEQV